jgi:IS30 family transposase
MAERQPDRTGVIKLARKYKILSFTDRQKIAALYSSGERACDIAERIGVSTATVYRDLQRGQAGGLNKNLQQAYSPEAAQRKAQAGFKRRGRRARK